MERAADIYCGLHNAVQEKGITVGPLYCGHLGELVKKCPVQRGVLISEAI